MKQLMIFCITGKGIVSHRIAAGGVGWVWDGISCI